MQRKDGEEVKGDNSGLSSSTPEYYYTVSSPKCVLSDSQNDAECPFCGLEDDSGFRICCDSRQFW